MVVGTRRLSLTRRRLLAGTGHVGAAQLATLALAACGRAGPETSTQSAAATKKPVTLIFESYASRAEFDYWKESLDLAHQKYPHITIDPAFVANPYDRWTVAMASDQGPSIMEFETKRMSSFAEKGTLLDLTGYAAKSKVASKADFLEADWEKTIYKGKLWLLVAMSKPAVFFYNTELLKRIGVDGLTTKWGTPEWTWDAFVQLCRKLTTGSGAGATYAYTQSTWWVYLQPFVWSNGGDFLNKDRTAGAVDQPAAIEALQKMQDLGLKDKAIPLAANNPEGGPSFTNGRVAISHGNSGAWIGYNQVPDLKWNIAPIPTGRQGTIARNPPNGWASWAGNKAPDATWLIIEEMVTPDSLRHIEGVPARKAQAESGDFAAAKALASTGGRWQVFIDAKKSSRDEPVTQYFQDLDKTISAMQDPYWRGTLAVKEWAAQLKTKIDAVQQGQGPQT